MGVWIETDCMFALPQNGQESHPAWVCGLKLRWVLLLLWIRVTPCVGVWIETFITNRYTGARIVTPCVGVWIETSQASIAGKGISSHTLRGCVD